MSMPKALDLFTTGDGIRPGSRKQPRPFHARNGIFWNRDTVNLTKTVVTTIDGFEPQRMPEQSKERKQTTSNKTLVLSTAVSSEVGTDVMLCDPEMREITLEMDLPPRNHQNSGDGDNDGEKTTVITMATMVSVAVVIQEAFFFPWR